MKMLFSKAGSDTTKLPKYLLLFGNGSYDYISKENNTNFVLTYQSEESLIPTASFTSDDYFGLLDLDEGNGENDLVDIGIGRLPVNNVREAHIAVKKITNYNATNFNEDLTKMKSLAWKNDICIIADDEDSNRHLNYAEDLSNIINKISPSLNVDKIYFDSYQQISTSDGEKYPNVNIAINNAITKGVLILNYIGHGNEYGWGHEDVLDVPTIKSWSNSDRLPLFFTATCEFCRFDDPSVQSAGELVFLNPNGGGIGLFTTTRLVFAGSNATLTQSFYRELLNLKNGGKTIRLGDINRLARNKSSNTGINRRNFTLIGDPALVIFEPTLKVKISNINGIKQENFKDTLKAFSKVRVDGEIINQHNNSVTNYQGLLFINIMDKQSKKETLGQDEKSYPQEFKTQKNTIYKGKATVRNGRFQFSFFIPKDIDYSVGNSKFSFYAISKNFEANGYLDNVLVGESLNKLILDKKGPEMELFMNDPSFIDGGITNEKPILMVKLFDEYGLNTTGTGIGHDISMFLDNKTDKQTSLNTFFESDIDTYKSGKIEYPLHKLAEGNHNISVRAWDINNNSSQEDINFVVLNSEELVLDKVLNYPNPFTTKTEFHYQHNHPNEELNVRVQIFTVSGKLVKTINKKVISHSFMGEKLTWNGEDDYGDKLGRGAYVYKFTVTTSSGKTDHKFEKLVILN